MVLDVVLGRWDALVKRVEDYRILTLVTMPEISAAPSIVHPCEVGSILTKVHEVPQGQP